MTRLRGRLTYSNVVATLALFLALAGGTAFAANQLAKNSVGSKQLKKNAVTTAKIKKSAVSGAKIKTGAVTTAKIKDAAVTGGKIADGSITGGKLADGSVTGAEIDPATTPFTRLVGSVTQNNVVLATSGSPYLVGTYTQPAGQVDTFVPGVTVRMPASCAAPRTFNAFILVNPENPASPMPTNMAGYALWEDKIGGDQVKQVAFASYPGGYAPLSYPAGPTATQFTYYVFPTGVSCASGSGIAIQGAKVNVLGTPEA